MLRIYISLDEIESRQSFKSLENNDTFESLIFLQPRIWNLWRTSDQRCFCPLRLSADRNRRTIPDCRFLRKLHPAHKMIIIRVKWPFERLDLADLAYEHWDILVLIALCRRYLRKIPIFWASRPSSRPISDILFLAWKLKSINVACFIYRISSKSEIAEIASILIIFFIYVLLLLLSDFTYGALLFKYF